jgi:hypothetical protein
MAVTQEEVLERMNALIEALQVSTAQKAVRPQGAGYRPIAKHSSDMISMPPPDLSTAEGQMYHRPLYEAGGPFGGFFQDEALRQAFLNMLVYPTDGLASMIPTRANNVIDDKFGFFMRYSVEPDSRFDEGSVCDPAIPLVSDYDFMKMGLPYGRLSHAIRTIDVTNLILKAQFRQFDDFYIVGKWRGVSAQPDISLFGNGAGGLERDLIVASAIRRKFADLGTYFQRQIFNWAWTGDPANTPGGTQIIQPYGMYRLINGKYSTAGLPIYTTAHAGGPTDDRMKDALSSIVVNLEGKSVGDGTFSLWKTLRSVEQLMYQRAANTGMLPVQWKIFMITPLWDQIVEHLPCELVADGCTIPGGAIEKQFHLNDGGTALYNMTTRQQMRDSQAITINGRTYPVVLDDTMPYTLVKDDQGGLVGYKSDIFFIPFTVVGGEQVLYWEYIDYSQLYQELGPIADRAMDAKGWTDQGYYYHTITTLRSCVEMQTEMQMRLIFKAPHLAARLDNLTSAATYVYPIAQDGAGGQTGWLVPPAA